MNDDLISRKYLIEAFKEEFFGMYSDDFNYMINWFKNLPAADPSVIAMEINVDKESFRRVMEGCELTFAPSEIVRCKYCRWWRAPDGCLHWDGMVNTIANGFCSYGERKSDG